MQGAQPTGERIPAFDLLRVIALLSGILFHAALSYADVSLGVLAWPGRDPEPSRIAAALLWWTRTFHLPLFFLLAGFFAAHSRANRGPSAFLRERIRRILIPYFVFGILLLPVTYYVFAAGWLLAGECSWNEIRRLKFEPRLQAQLYGPAHLWFLQYLFVYSLAWWACGARTNRRTESRRASLGLLLWWSIPAAAVLLATDSTVVTEHLNSFGFDFWRFLYYAVFFAAGIQLHSMRDGLDRWPAAGLRCLLASLPCFVLAEALVRNSAGESPFAARALLAASLSLCAWLSILGLLGVSFQFASRPRARVRRLAEASYWMYLVHLPLTVGLQILLVSVPAPSLLKLVLVAMLATLFSFRSYERWIRGSLVAALLEGRFRPRVSTAFGSETPPLPAGRG